jgi:DNA-binding MarR family transcriptional regulator
MERDLLPDQLGRFFQDNGLPRTAGQVLGHLLVCDPPEQSFDELVDSVGASRSTVSVTTRLLIQLGLVERFAVRGERRDRYRLSPTAWTAMLEQDIAAARRLRALAEAGLEHLRGRPAEQRARLLAMKRFYTFLEEAYAPLVDRWNRASAPSKRAPRRSAPTRRQR